MIKSFLGAFVNMLMIRLCIEIMLKTGFKVINIGFWHNFYKKKPVQYFDDNYIIS